MAHGIWIKIKKELLFKVQNCSIAIKKMKYKNPSMFTSKINNTVVSVRNGYRKNKLYGVPITKGWKKQDFPNKFDSRKLES